MLPKISYLRGGRQATQVIVAKVQSNNVAAYCFMLR